MNSHTNINLIHIIARDKFTLGYIRFMEFYFTQYRHTFITFSAEDNDEYKNDQNIILLEHKSEIIHDKAVQEILRFADKIIVTGVFGLIQNYMARCGRGVLGKTYFQFWGGDFYTFRNRKITGFHTLKNELYNRRIMIYCIKHCAGIINLIPGDWDEFYKIFPYDVKHFVAPMCGDPGKPIDYEAYRRKSRESETIERANGTKVVRILVGNSATRTNCHLDAFEKLSGFADEDIEVVVPLSYGDGDEYRDEVIREGSLIFGNKFRPVKQYMAKEDYISLLNTCDLALFNNDRQQGMGNIGMLLSLGKKVYARPDTSMWRNYINYGIVLYDINSIRNMNYDDFITMSDDTVANNITQMNEMRRVERKIELWKRVFED